MIASASDYEGFGVAAVEGMSAGLFPLLSDIPTFRHLVALTGVGMLVDFADAEGAVDAFIGKWHEIEVNYSDYRRTSVDAASVYDWQRVSQAYEAMYDEYLWSNGADHSGSANSCWHGFTTVEMLDDRFERRTPPSWLLQMLTH